MKSFVSFPAAVLLAVLLCAAFWSNTEATLPLIVDGLAPLLSVAIGPCTKVATKAQCKEAVRTTPFCDDQVRDYLDSCPAHPKTIGLLIIKLIEKLDVKITGPVCKPALIKLGVLTKDGLLNLVLGANEKGAYDSFCKCEDKNDVIADLTALVEALEAATPKKTDVIDATKALKAAIEAACEDESKCSNVCAEIAAFIKVATDCYVCL